MLGHRGFYFQASNGSVVLPVTGYDYNSDWTPLLAGLPTARMAASLAGEPYAESCKYGSGATGASLHTGARTPGAEAHLHGDIALIPAVGVDHMSCTKSNQLGERAEQVHGLHFKVGAAL